MKSKLQLTRFIAQIAVLVLWALGFYHQLHSIIFILLIATLIFGNFFCGWVCPFGSVQEVMGRLGSLLVREKLHTPKWLQRYLQFSRYILAIIFFYNIGPDILYQTNGYRSFLSIIYRDTLTFSASIIFIISYLIIATFFDRPFCNYLCSEGARYGIASLARIFSIKRDTESCVDCGLCDKSCPMNISISDKDYVRNWQCINCFKCTDACPKNGTLTYKYVGWKSQKKKCANHLHEE